MRVIETESLTKIYGKRRVVDGVTFHVEKGQVFGFLGPNGSGKTTTIGMLLGILNISEGTVRLFETTDLTAVRQRIGATLETPNFYPYLSGYDNLRIVAKIKGATEKHIQAALELVELSARQKDKFNTYSLGMKQRLAIAAAALSNPELIILDEPTNGLDPEGIRDVRRIIQSLAASGKTVFLSSHLLSEVEQTCTHLAIIKQGKILKQGSLREIVSTHPLARLRADNMEQLKTAVHKYDKFISATEDGDALLVELSDGNLAELNRYLFENGIVLSHLALQHQTLEEAFLELTEA